MPKPAALTKEQARHSLAHRLAPRVDRIRQIATKLGIRPYLVSLVWTAFAGSERGEGAEVEIRRIQLLPTPRVMTMDSVMFNPFAIGLIPIGMIRVQLISAQYTFDQLTGRWVPEPHELHIPQPIAFRYEITEDGRGDPNPRSQKYRLASNPHRAAGQVAWQLWLERIGTDDDAASSGDGLQRCPP
jgi:hypothetical protein